MWTLSLRYISEYKFLPEICFVVKISTTIFEVNYLDFLVHVLLLLSDYYDYTNKELAGEDLRDVHIIFVNIFIEKISDKYYITKECQNTLNKINNNS